ncbi:hypothetical protein DDE19_17655 [Micromonospora ureilytica]|uniref:Uncharacterized protein n=1 Tax=Micromonospora ureilytica TaxID=709868 RepID=A0A3N9XSD0_9ACTN|nr:hypothetical protein [Micromonospora ureilytica]RQX15840.1 hypothetical protein DDE19_17655 [Micromonospora ureilytica]
MLAAEAPKITDWMQAWGSVVGLLLSGLAAMATWLLFRHEIQVRREEQRDNEAAQARLIVPVLSDPPQGPDEVRSFTIANYSGVPFYDLRVMLLRNARLIGNYPSALHVLMGEVAGSFSYLEVPGVDVAGIAKTGDLAIGVYFTDASGLRWSKLNREPPIRVRLDDRWAVLDTIRDRQRAAARARLEKEMALRAMTYRSRSRFRLAATIALLVAVAIFVAFLIYR